MIINLKKAQELTLKEGIAWAIVDTYILKGDGRPKVLTAEESQEVDELGIYQSGFLDAFLYFREKGFIDG